MKESVLQKKILTWLQANGYYAIKVEKANRAGVPDILACASGRFIGLEIKIGNNKPSALQESHIRQINEANGIAKVVWSLEEVKELFHNTALSADDQNWLSLS